MTKPASINLLPDDHAVELGTRQELIDGVVVETMPAAPPHAQHHFQLDYVLAAHVAPGYVGATDLLTRTSERWNFAADAAIRKKGSDPATGARYLEEMAFEIKYTQRTRDITERARQLARRGVRRVFGIWVRGDRSALCMQVGPVREWSTEHDGWVDLGLDEYIEDPCLHRPLEVCALVDSLAADNAVVRALQARGNPLLAELESEGYRRGVADGLRETATILCETLTVELSDTRRARLAELDEAALRSLIAHLRRQRRWPAVL
ncbi:MAG: hypothetical protein AAGC55_33540 [Myxococcota bacterium]